MKDFSLFWFGTGTLSIRKPKRYDIDIKQLVKFELL